MAVDFYGAVKATKLKPKSGISFARTEGGLVTSSRHFDDYWQATMTTPNLSDDTRKGWLAWLDDCVDMNRRVDFVHPRYRYPIGYDVASWPAGSDPLLVAVTDLRHVRVSGLQVGVVLRAGSRLSLLQNEFVCYRKIIDTVTVSSDTDQALAIGPRLFPGVFTAGATVRFVNPPVRLMVVPETWEADEDVEPTNLTFEMEESLI